MSFKQTIKRIVPKQVHYLYNRLVSRKKIREIYGDWFELDWKKQAFAADEKKWKEVYDRSWEHWTEQDLTPLDLKKIGSLVPDKVSVLDAGCGDGYLLQSLQGHGRTLTGIDLSELAIVKAGERLGEGVALSAGNVERLPFADKSFDVVVSAHTLEHVQNFEVAVSELIRVCKQRLIILVPSQEYLPYTEDYHLQFFPHEEDLVKRIPLSNVKIECYTVEKGDGKYGGDVLLAVVELE